MAAVAAARAEAAARPGAVIFVSQDEFTADRRPSVARAWHEAGGPGRPAELGHKSNNERRLIQHDFGDDWVGLRAAVTAWLQRWSGPSPGLLRYVGLCPG